jgi:putative heme-binding domain-containing protein
VQLRAAQSIAGSAAGGETLLAAVESGKLSPQLLTDRGIQFRLAVFKVTDADKRVAKLTKGLPEASVELQQLIDRRRKAFSPDSASAERGMQVFATNCAACHQIDGKGATVGPQLDGAGTRGLDRLVEDILDPNRNVDPAFRYSILELKDGTADTGLQRREEGEVLVFADSTGKELKVPKSEIKSRRETNLSLMPGNFADLIPEPVFNDLMAYLLSKHAAPPAP